MIADSLQNIPKEMRSYDQWVVWAYEQREREKPTKVLYNAATGYKGSTTDPTTWSGFDDAVAVARNGKFDGLGFVFADSDPFCGVDFDVEDMPTKLQQFALEKLDSYAELSPSGLGAHVIVKGRIPAGRNNQSLGIEMYSSGRFFTMTGNVLGEPKFIAERSELVNELWTEIGGQHDSAIPNRDPSPANALTDDVLVDRIRESDTNRRNFDGQVSDWSNAYFALICAACLFSSDERQVRRVIMASPLVKDAPPKGRETRADKAERLWTREYGRAALRGAQERQERAVGVIHGRQIAQALLTGWQAAIPGLPPPRFRVLHVSDVEAREPDYLVADLIEERSCVVVFGTPGSGKSFVTLDIAACVATDREFHGKEVQAGCAVYVAGEGGSGIKRRLQAWSKHTGEALDKSKPLFIIPSPIEMLNAADVDAACFAISEAVGASKMRVIVLDTLARNFGDGDENSTSDMNRFVAAVGRMIERFNCTVIIVHHSGHGDSSRGRGSSALRAAADAEFLVSKEHDIVTLAHTKAKDAPETTPMLFSLESVELGKRKDGEPYTSAVLVEREAQVSRANKRSPSQQRAMKAYTTAAKDAGQFASDGSYIGVHRDEWRKAFYKIATQDNEDSKSKAFRRACTDLVEKGELDVADDVFSYARHHAMLKNQAIKVMRTAGQDADITGHVQPARP